MIRPRGKEEGGWLGLHKQHGKREDGGLGRPTPRNRRTRTAPPNGARSPPATFMARAGTRQAGAGAAPALSGCVPRAGDLRARPPRPATERTHTRPAGHTSGSTLGPCPCPSTHLPALNTSFPTAVGTTPGTEKRSNVETPLSAPNVKKQKVIPKRNAPDSQ